MTSRKITCGNAKLPLTLANLRTFLEQCENVGIPDDAVIVEVRSTMGGKLKSLSATDENRRPEPADVDEPPFTTGGPSSAVPARRP